MRESRISLRGGERRCEWTRIDSEQHIALLDIGTVLEIARNNLSIYLCLHLNHFRRGASTDFIQVKRNIFGDNFCHCHGPRRWRRGCFCLLVMARIVKSTTTSATAPATT